MMNGMVRPENIADFSGRIYKEANRLGNLVADIIQLSRLDEQQDAVVSMESVELDELAKDVVNNSGSGDGKKENISLDIVVFQSTFREYGMFYMKCCTILRTMLSVTPIREDIFIFMWAEKETVLFTG